MGYRFEDKPKPMPDDVLPIFDMYNQEDRIWSIPCFYLNVEKPIDWHDYKWHDHHGWPAPNHPDHMCQAVPNYPVSPATVYNYIDMGKAIKINLTNEGYTNVVVVLDSVDGSTDIEATGTIRQDEPWIVDLRFKANLTSFAGEPKEFKFNAYAIENYERKDLLVRGKLVIFPG